MTGPARSRSHHSTHPHTHAIIFFYIYLIYRLFSVVGGCCRLQHRTPDAVFLGAFVALLLSVLSTVMGYFVEVETELIWTHSVGINTT